jgi:hypothetical protein
MQKTMELFSQRLTTIELQALVKRKNTDRWNSQCINILKGEMAVVGPRPERPNFVKRKKGCRFMKLDML